MIEFGKSLLDRLVIENIGIMLTDVAKFLHKALIVASVAMGHIYIATLQNGLIAILVALVQTSSSN